MSKNDFSLLIGLGRGANPMANDGYSAIDGESGVNAH